MAGSESTQAMRVLERERKVESLLFNEKENIYFFWKIIVDLYLEVSS